MNNPDDKHDKNVPVILEDLTLRFNGRAALDSINLEFPEGTCTAVIGGSGSGKSLILKCAAGLKFPDEGRVIFKGTAISSMGEKQYQRMQAGTGFHFQDAALWANKSLAENLSMPLLTAHPEYTDKDLKDRIAESFASVGLNLDPGLRPAGVSMGQQKLVSFLRATITRPEILFLDDPLSFMDHAGSRQLMAGIKEFRDAGATIIIATHNRDLSEKMADRVAVLSEGRLAAAGGYQEVLSSQDPALMPLLRELL